MEQSLSLDSLPTVLAAYMKGTPQLQRELIAAYPDIFGFEVLAALADASAQIASTLRETKEACAAIDSLANHLDLPGTSSMVRVQPAERAHLEQREAIITTFTNTLSQFLQEARGARRAAFASSQPTAAVELLPAGQSNPAGAWHQSPVLVFEILSFLRAEEVFLAAEDVCSAWRYWLFDQGTSRPFWVGCVQREYPFHLQVFMQDDDPLTADWRTLAMKCITAEEEEEEEEGEGAPDCCSRTSLSSGCVLPVKGANWV